MTDKLTTVAAAGYDVTIGYNPFGHLARVLDAVLISGNGFCIIMDDNTHDHCYPVLLDLCPKAAAGRKIIIPPGDKNKTYNSLSHLTEEMTKMGADRGSLVVNLGGGMICDVGGLAASLFKRGVGFINIPTTLLAMVDASIGGKVGINQNNYKNQVGLFTQPQGVLVSPHFLKSLDNVMLVEGLIEACKHGLVYDQKYWVELTEQFPGSLSTESPYLENAIIKSVQIKHEIVTKDFKEAGVRKVLNFGHTIGHALEKLALDNSVQPISHGQAVAIGIVCEAYLSRLKTGLSEKSLAEIANFFMPLFKPYAISEKEKSHLHDCILQDKKTLGGKTHFTLISSIGNAKINQAVTKNEILDAVAYYQEQINR